MNNEKEDSHEDILEDAKENFKRAIEHEADNRRLWLDDVKFARLGEQWPDKIKQQREREGRPCLTINRLPAFIRQVTNDARQNKPAIKVHPVSDGANAETAEIISGLIRNIEYTSNADIAYDTALDHAVSGGFGYIRVDIDYACDDVFEKDIRIERIANPLTVYGDYNSTCADSSDWNIAFITELLSKDDFKIKYPDAEDTQSWSDDGSEKDADWFEGEKVRIAEYWVRKKVPKTLLKLSDGTVMLEEVYLTPTDGIAPKSLCDAQGLTIVSKRQTMSYEVWQHIVTGAEVIESTKWAGQYIPIIPVYGDEVMVEGKRTFNSLIRFAKDPQQMFNFWRTASTELVALAPKAPFIGPVGAFNSDADKWATANTETHAYIEYDIVDGGPPQRQPFSGVPAGALQEALNAADDMKSIMGIYDASLGAKSNETSGRAILARQREGDVGTFNFVDNLSRAIRHLGRVVVDLTPKVYNTERIVRVIHEDKTNEKVTINAPHMPPAAEQGQGDPILDMQQQGIASQNPQEDNPMVKFYDLTSGKYDITIESGPSYTTKREESADQMLQFVQAMPNAVPVIGDLIAKNLDWPGADDIAERLKAMLPPQLQGQNPQVEELKQALQQQDQHAKDAVSQLQGQLQQMGQQMQDLQQQASDTQAVNQLKQQELSIKSQEAETKRFEAETRRMEAEVSLLDATTPKQESLQQPSPNLSTEPSSQDQLIELMQAMREELSQSIHGAQTISIRPIRNKQGRLEGAVQIKADGSEVPITIQ